MGSGIHQGCGSPLTKSELYGCIRLYCEVHCAVLGFVILPKFRRVKQTVMLWYMGQSSILWSTGTDQVLLTAPSHKIIIPGLQHTACVGTGPVAPSRDLCAMKDTEKLPILLTQCTETTLYFETSYNETATVSCIFCFKHSHTCLQLTICASTVVFTSSSRSRAGEQLNLTQLPDAEHSAHSTPHRAQTSV